ncbi:MAG: restriction endonuclease subunit S [Alphaproteobacteria bacterium]
MPIDWQTCRLGDLVDIYDGPHATPKKVESGPIFLGISSLAHGRLNLSAIERLSEADFVRWTRRVTPSPGDIVFSYETRLGEAALIPVGIRCCLGRRMGLLRPKVGRVDARFLLYAYLGDEFQETLRQRAIHGSTVDRIPLIEMPDFAIRIPSLPEQRAIAHILGTLDDKIDLNRRMNETLEAMARALFKSWFVDFDPVRAKAEGRDPCVPEHVAKLVPAAFDDEGTPSGWTRRTVREIADVLSGGTPHRGTAKFWSGAIPWISPKAMTSIHVVRSDDCVSEEAIGRGTRLAPEGAVLVMVRGMGLHDGVRISQARRAVTFNQDVKALIPRKVNSTFLLFALLHAAPLLHSKVRAAGHGTGVLPTEALDELTFSVPPSDDLDQLAQPLMVLNEKIAMNDRNSEMLALLRDALLPRLISGEIRVNQAERFVESATA